MSEAMRLVGAILIILGAAGALSNWLVDQEIPNQLFELTLENPYWNPRSLEAGPLRRLLQGAWSGERPPQAY